MRFVTEMPKDTKQKLEIKNGIVVLDRLLDISVPYNYGYLKDTLSEDGDPLDAFIVGVKTKIHPGVEVECYPLFGYTCTDNGIYDHKLIVAPVFVHTLDLDLNLIAQNITQYLNSYKEGFNINNIINMPQAQKLYYQAVCRSLKDAT